MLWELQFRGRSWWCGPGQSIRSAAKAIGITGKVHIQVMLPRATTWEEKKPDFEPTAGTTVNIARLFHQ